MTAAPSLLEREHPQFHKADYRPAYCSLCWPNGAPASAQAPAPAATEPVVEQAPTPAAVRRSRHRGEDGWQPLRAAMERFRSRVVVDQPDEPDSDLAADGGPRCDVCRDSRWLRRDVPITDPSFGRLVPCHSAVCTRFLQERHYARFWASVPDGYRGPDGRPRSLESFPTRDPAHRRAVELVRQWLEAPDGPDGRPWLYLSGETGRGKTSLAIAAAMARGGAALFVTVPDLLVRLASTFDHIDGERDQVSELKLLEHLWTVSVLVLDDFGAESPTPWAAQRVYQVVNARSSDRGLVTIVTSNLESRRLAGHLNRANSEHGARTASRIIGRSQPYVVEVGGPDLRLRGLVRSMGDGHA